MTAEEYRKNDLSFNSSVFISNFNQMLNNIYEAISNNDIEDVRSYMTDKAYQKIKSIVERNCKEGMVLKYENVSVDSEIQTFDNMRGTSVIKVISTCIFSKNYYIDNVLQEEVSVKKVRVGHKFSVCKKDNTVSFYSCDNCGASYNILDNKKCPYCGKDFNYEPCDYIIVEMEY